MLLVAVELSEPPQTLLSLGRHSSIEGGSDIVVSIVVHKGSEYVYYGLM